MKKQWINLKWLIACKNCYREQYCQFNIDTNYCIMFRPKENTDVNIITKQQSRKKGQI